MHMMVKKRQCKLVALFLLIVFLVPFIPVAPVAADPLPVQVPDFPYGQDSYYNVNNGGFALWQVHGSNYVSYVQTFSPGAVGKPDPIIIFNKTIFYDNYTYYLDVNYIIDTWDIYGNHLDGWPGSNTSNIRVPRPYQEVADSDVYATLVYCSDDVRWRNGSDTGIYMYMNYLVPSYADPTPTPIPIVPNVIVMYGDYEPFQLGDIPNYGTDIFANGFEATGEVINIANALPGHQPTYASIFAGIDYDNYHRPYFGIFITDSNTMDNPFVNAGVVMQYNVYGPYTSVDGTVTKYVHYYIRDGGLDWSVYGKPNLDNVNIPQFYWEDSALTKVNSGRYPYLAGYGYCDFYGFNGQTNPNVSPTPTPTAVPTAIPQPTQNPDPTATPEPDVKVVTPSDHWWDGLVKPIQYIFVPSQDKMMKTYNTFANKFGVQKPTEFTFDPNALFRPDNVVWDFHPISLNGEATEPVEVTIIDFEMVDDWLDSAPGRMIIRIVKAVFGLTMWAYMIYIFRKHIATINYTDAATLMDEDTWQKKGGDD